MNIVQPPSIILLASYSPSLVLFRGTLIQRLIRAGYRVIGCGPPDDAVAAELTRRGAEFHPVGPRRASLNPFTDLAYLVSLILLLAKLKPHAVLAYTAKPVIWGCLAAWLARIPIRVALITGTGFGFGTEAVRGGWARVIVRSLYRMALKCASSVIFQNPDDQKEFERLRLVEAGTSRWVNGSGVELDRFVPAALPGTGSFLLIARLIADKGVREYAQAAALLRARHPSARFRLVGWFDENPATLSRTEIDDWVAEGCIEFLGKLDDVRSAIADADVYVLPSYREGTPRTVLEAMAMGRPIVTTDVPGCRQTVADGVNGFLVPPRDPVALREAMERFLDERGLALRMGRESRRLAVERFDAESVAKATIDAARL